MHWHAGLAEMISLESDQIRLLLIKIDQLVNPNGLVLVALLADHHVRFVQGEGDDPAGVDVPLKVAARLKSANAIIARTTYPHDPVEHFARRANDQLLGESGISGDFKCKF
jgi:hypothetical protein